jgi:hypothetical protein
MVIFHCHVSLPEGILMWVKQYHKPSPIYITIFIGGMFTIPGWFLTLFLPTLIETYKQ